MIVDQLKNKSFYVKEETGFSKAFTFLEDFLKNPLEDGRYEIDEDNVFAIVQSYETKANGMLEAHNDYIDIQFMAKGCEKIEYANRENLGILKKYENDIVFLEDSNENSSLILKKNNFAIFYPQDAHKPCLAVKHPQKVVKVVVKVRNSGKIFLRKGLNE